jgi:hypothetical protein
MQFGIFPVRKPAVAIESWAVKMDHLAIVLQKPDVSSKKQMLALYAKAHLIERPPLL